MNIDVLLLIACIPIILMCAYIYNEDKDKEPFKILRKLFLYGILSIIPIVILELLTARIAVYDSRNIISLFINTFVTVGIIEEGTKWVVVNKASYNDIEFNHAYDAIIYCVFVSLGFALVENIFYLIDEDITVGVLRGITTIPAHTFNAIVMGYFLGKSKQEDFNRNEDSAKKYMFLSLLAPIICHTIYDFLIFRQTTSASILFIVFVVIMYVMSIMLVRKVSIIKKNFDGSKYDSKEKREFNSDSDLFIDALIKVLIVTLVLIAISAIIIFI